jgi:hypothetical protein
MEHCRQGYERKGLAHGEKGQVVGGENERSHPCLPRFM